MRKYLTKSIFKIGLECPRKLYYHKKLDEYLNSKVEDPFLESLAQGGYKVGALAQLKYPNGIEIKGLDYEKTYQESSKLLNQENVVLFEPAFMSGNLFVRADIVIKAGNKLRLIEVKSKSIDTSEEDNFLKKKSTPERPELYAGWVPYFYDLAFQVFVARANYPDLEISASLLLMDKATSAKEDGLHQYFLVKRNGTSKEVTLTKEIPKDFKGHSLLKEVDVTDIIIAIIEGREASEFHIKGNMADKAKAIADIYLKNQKTPCAALIGKNCKSCEFRGSDEKLKSGFDECWIEAANIASASSQKLSIDLWNFRGADKAVENQIYLLKDLEAENLSQNGGVLAERQAIHIEKVKSGDSSPWFDHSKLKAEMESWTYSLHFIDFETCMPAIPFKKGFGPYSEVAFQFSHHVMTKDGKVSHVGEYINLEPNTFPSFDFVRELKRQLEKDSGTVFRYSNHENSVLNRIVRLLEISGEPDKQDLISFIKTLTKKKGEEKDSVLWQGERLMVDLLEVVKECYYSPLIGSSYSLKYVLPAILNESEFLKKKYSQKIYGTKDLPSLNFKDHAWIKLENGEYSAAPYKELPPLFSAEDLEKIQYMVSDEDEIRNGGSAMMAYCRTQFTEMTAQEREAIKKALLKYCELDTLAMVMLVEYWRSIIE